jgi:hypothetical protein
MWNDDSGNTTITFTYKSTDKNGNTTTYLERSLHDEDTDTLTPILQEFVYFLNGMTYNYVGSVIATKTDGVEVASSD